MGQRESGYTRFKDTLERGRKEESKYYRYKGTWDKGSLGTLGSKALGVEEAWDCDLRHSRGLGTGYSRDSREDVARAVLPWALWMR